MSIRYAFYGDDFTGSTDVLEQLASNGVPAVLFLGVPSPAQLAVFPDVEAIGIAGDSRSRSPAWMSAHLPAIFEALKQLGASVMHYKVCSTFDSSPAHGSIGRAIELGIEAFRPRFVPVVVGAPHLRRFVAFGNLFAAAPDGTVQRIDRHPMSRHPVTPMRESDLRVHLGLQTETSLGLVDLSVLQTGDVERAIEKEIVFGRRAILFDTIDAETQRAVGEILWSEAKKYPFFSASSSGLTAALISAWRNDGLLVENRAASLTGSAGPLLVVSGSCSAVTERQLRWAFAHGYEGIRLDPETVYESRRETLENAAALLNAGRNTILYTSLGAPATGPAGDHLGETLGLLLKELLPLTGARRVLLCGGDTSSHAVQQLGLSALTWLATLQPGAPLCRAHAESTLDGLELVLKGGQVGTDDFFDVVRQA